MSCCMQIATHQLPTLLHPAPFRLAAGLATCPVLHGHQLVCLLHIQQAAEIAIYEFRVLVPKCLLQGRMTTREYQGRKPSGQGCNREHGGNPATPTDASAVIRRLQRHSLTHPQTQGSLPTTPGVLSVLPSAAFAV